MIAMVLALVVDRLRLGRIPPLHLLSAALVLVLGAATLILRDVRFLKWKRRSSSGSWRGGGRKRLVQRHAAGAAAAAAMIAHRRSAAARAVAELTGSGWCSTPARRTDLWIAYHRSERDGSIQILRPHRGLALFAMVQAAWLASRPEVRAAQPHEQFRHRDARVHGAPYRTPAAAAARTHAPRSAG